MLLELLAIALSLTALVLLVPVGLLFVQVLAATLPGSRESREELSTLARPRITVLVPAHDEAAGIAAALSTMRAQLQRGDRLLVVADNCTDNTARVAASAGAEVIERIDASRRGKSYALDFGVRHLESAPPDVVVIVDADCELHPGSLDRLGQLSAQTGRPVQALDLMHAPPGAGLRTRIAAFAWVVKNHARPLGSLRLRLPCQLMGTGMALPWPLVRGAHLATGHLVEDLLLGLDLAAGGKAPIFCPQAKVTSLFPSSSQGIADQSARWERGQLGLILRMAPRLLWRATTDRRPHLAAMVLDLCVPPLTLLTVLLIVQVAVDALLVAVGGSATPLWLALAALALLLVAVALAWLRFGRRVVSLGDLLRIPLYVMAKLPLYKRFFRREKPEWVRAQRDGRRD